MALDLQAITEALAKATPGPWQALFSHPYYYANGDTDTPVDGYWVEIPPPGNLGDYECQGYTKADAALIVLLRNHAAELVAEIERLRAGLTKGEMRLEGDEWLTTPEADEVRERLAANGITGELGPRIVCSCGASIVATKQNTQPEQEAPHG